MTTDDLILQTLRKSTLAEELRDAEIAALVNIITVHEYKKGEYLIQPGDSKLMNALLIVLLVYGVIAGGALRTLLFLLSHQMRHQLVHAHIHVHIVFGLAGDNQRGARLVYQNGIHLVHNGEIQLALEAFAGMGGHVVAQVIEAEFVVGAIGNVRRVGSPLVGVVHLRQDHPHR